VFGRIKQELAEGKALIVFTSLRAIGQALAMVTPLVVARFFAPDLFASYSLARMVLFFLLSVLVCSSQIPFIVFANQEKVERGKINKTFSVQCTFWLVGLCLFGVVALTLHRYIMAFAGIGRGDLVFVFLAFLGLSVKTSLCNLLMALNQRVKNSVVEFVFGAVNVSLVVMLCLLDKVTLRAVFLVHFLASALVVAGFICVVDFKLLRPFDLDRKYLRQIYNFTKWVFMGATAAYFINWGDNLVLRYYVPMAEIGVYNLGYQLFKGLAILIPVFGSYFLPFLSQHIKDQTKIRRYLNSKRPRILVVGMVGIVLVFVAAPYIFRIYADVYGEAVTVFRTLLIGSAIILYTSFYDPLLNVTKVYRFAQTVNLVQVLLNLLLDVLLVPFMGMLGAAVATVVAYFCRAITIEVNFRVRLRRTLGL